MKLADIYNNKNFEIYYDLLLEYNSKFNLTAILNKEDIYLKHFLDSLLVIDLIKDNSKVLDIGAGAGFPSIPIKIINNSLQFLLIDSVNKKITFLEELIKRLNLNNISAKHTRIEDLKEFDFDYVLARAVAPMNTLLEYSLPFLKKGGKLIAYKGQNVNEELKNIDSALKILGGRIESIIEKNLTDEIKRSFVIVEKINSCDKKYPRGLNKPRLNPL